MSKNARNSKNYVLDDIDLTLIEHLQNNARITNAELGEVTGLSPSGVQKRLKKLEERRVIKKYATLIDRKILGYDLLVFVQIILKGHTPEAISRFDEAIQAMPEVLECHRITGNADYLLKVVARDHEHLDNLLMNELMRLPAVERVHSNIVLKEIKEITRIDVMG